MLKCAYFVCLKGTFLGRIYSQQGTNTHNSVRFPNMSWSSFEKQCTSLLTGALTLKSVIL